jgi:Tfp pilus assembly protein PilF/peroxiredoxin
MRGRFVAAALVAVVLLGGAPHAAAAFRNVSEGAEAPAFVLKDLGGNAVSLDAVKKEKAVLVVFWATWSARSLEELADLAKLQAELGPKGLKVLAVNVEHEHAAQDEVEGMRRRAEEGKWSFPVLLDPGLETYRSFGVVAVPSTGLFSEGAVLRKSLSGYPSFALGEIREEAEVLLGLRKREEGKGEQAAKPAYQPVRAAFLQYNLGRRLLETGGADKALPKVKAAVVADPKWVPPRLLLGDLYLLQGKKDPSKVEEAKKEFQAALQAEPENAVARTGLARVYFRLGAFPDAERETAEAIRRNPAYPPALLLDAALLAKRGKAAEAAKRVDEALALNPRDPEGYALAGRAFEAGGDIAKAAAMYRKAYGLMD